MNKFILFMSLKTKIEKEVVLDTASGERGQRGHQPYKWSTRMCVTHLEYNTKNPRLYETFIIVVLRSFMYQKNEFFCFSSLEAAGILHSIELKSRGENKNFKKLKFSFLREPKYSCAFALMDQKRAISGKQKKRCSYLQRKTPKKNKRAPTPGAAGTGARTNSLGTPD